VDDTGLLMDQAPIVQ